MDKQTHEEPAQKEPSSSGEYYGKLYAQRVAGERPEEEFRRKDDLTPAQVEQEELFQAQKTKEERDEPGYENGNVAEIDHPWHQWMGWESCYSRYLRS